ncbi:DUF2207 domain-containing protein [Modestobacter roseus]|uniref:Putative membrane protein DUF2207 n=1 Tax=Modestobacter roseus TaxID=1181884 RepID=A0A562IPR3_9ACTN|nr:DUF2207 domain-containing protein [Modestobacter roseus]MQA34494.1 DUF2207 domain-containing protein [Modestobacter roseus]TWH73019.1 putative membrane protein DUF2207 [Modestobacter roseus]
MDGRRRAGVASGLVLGAVLLGGCTGGGPAEAIRSYDVRIEAAADGSLQVEEVIEYDFGDEERHGIERLIPERLPYAQTRDRLHPVSDVTVESPSGAPVDTELLREDGVLTLRVGDEDTEVSGRHTYEIGYRVAGVADADELRWNAVGTGWSVPVDDVDVRVAGPSGAAPVEADCVVGAEGSRTPCDVTVEPGGELHAQASGLAPEEGVTVAGRWPAGTFAAAEPIYDDTFSPARAFRATPATAGLALAALLALAGPVVLLARRGRPRRASGPVPPQLTPPRDGRPAQLGTVLDGHAQRHEVTATLLDLAVRGHLRIEETGGRAADGSDGPADWRLVRTGKDLRGLRGYEQLLLDGVFAEGDVVTLSELQPRFGGLDGRVRSALYTDVVELGWFTADPAAVRRRWYARGAVLLGTGVVLTVVLAAVGTWALAGLGVVVAGLVVLGLAGRMPQRTAEGAQVHQQVVAFRDSLAASDALARVPAGRVDDLAGDPRARYLPHAVALGVANQFAAALEAAGPAPAADWYVPAHGAGYVGVWPSLVAFSSPDNPVLSPPVSSGGGATSVGGAAGGGGGGSW